MRIKNLIRSLFVFVFFVPVFISYTNASDYKYTNLDINADVLIDWTINVKETYTADFLVKKHGIFRTIPLNYSVDWNKFHIDISNINVVWKKFTTKRSRGERTIKIWDPDKYVYWKVDYPISYTVYGLIKNFSGMWYSELYWNIVGHQFDTSIWNVTAVINLPKSYTWFESSDFLITADWLTKTVEQFQWTVDWTNSDKIIITYDKWLAAYHWITLAVKFPNNYFKFDDSKQAKLLWDARIWISWIVWAIRSFFANINIRENIESIFWILLFVFIAPLVILFKALQVKHESKINLRKYNLKWEFADKYKVIVQYAPPKWLNSAEVWLLLHRKAEIKDLFSLIYKRAAEWLIEIDADISSTRLKIRLFNSIRIKKLKEIWDSAPEFEKIFFDSFMYKDEVDVLNYDIKHFDDLNNLKNHWINMWWFILNKNSMFIAIIVIVSLIFMFLLPIFWILIAIILCLIFWKRLNTKLKETEKWAELIAHILWYRQFVVACDEMQLRTFLAQDPLYFDKTLPYAVVFWVETEFLKKITPIMEEYNITPTWYSWDLTNIGYCISSTNIAWTQSVYTESSWFSSWSSFWWWGWGFSGGWGWWGGWWWSW